MNLTFRTLMLSVVILAGCTSESPAGPKVYVGKQWNAQQLIPIGSIDHQVLDELLRKYVDDKGNVDYNGWKKATADVRRLDAYLAHLSQANRGVRSSEPEKLAYWINAYNAVTIRGILREYPTSSIRNHTARVVGYNIWHDLLLHVGGTAVSLDDIEHKILRKMGEPRIHFAIVCASTSCPKLRNEAYVPESLDKQLTANSVDFFANPRNFRYSSGRVYLSSILKWFAVDFGANQTDRLRYISRFLPEQTGRAVKAQAGSLSVSYLDYDWSLNDQASQ